MTKKKKKKKKKPKLIGQAVLQLIQFLCDYFGSGQPGSKEWSPYTIYLVSHRNNIGYMIGIFLICAQSSSYKLFREENTYAGPSHSCLVSLLESEPPGKTEDVQEFEFGIDFLIFRMLSI